LRRVGGDTRRIAIRRLERLIDDLSRQREVSLGACTVANRDVCEAERRQEKDRENRCRRLRETQPDPLLPLAPGFLPRSRFDALVRKGMRQESILA